MEITMMESGKIIKKMDLENFIGVIVTFMKETFRMIYYLDKELLITKTEINTKDNGRIIYKQDLEFIHGLMEIFLKVSFLIQ